MPIVIVCWTIVLPWLVWEFLRYQHGFKQIDRDLIIGLIAPMALLVTVEFRLINNYYPFIAVEPPGAFQLNTGQYPTKQTVRVTNTKSATLYSVFVKIWTEDKGVEAADIMIEPDKPTRPDLTGKMGQYTISSDVMMRDIIDLDDREAVLVRFLAMSHQETRYLTVFGNNPIKSTAFVKVMGFQHKQARVSQIQEVREDGKIEQGVDIQWALPDGKTVKGIRQKITTN
jgi:hypothetical protein